MLFTLSLLDTVLLFTIYTKYTVYKASVSSGSVQRIVSKVKVKVKVTLRPTYESASPSWRQAPIWDPRPI
jgi:hypothetical protein